jgi:hypothetical protein
VPAFVATGAVLEFAEGAVRKGSTDALVHAAIAIAVAIALAWFATRYLRRAQESATAPAGAPVS